MMNNREYIGKRIAEIRQAKGLSIRQLAEKSGVNFANVYKIENGKYNVSIDILGKICDALGYHVDIMKNLNEAVVTKEETERIMEHLRNLSNKPAVIVERKNEKIKKNSMETSDKIITDLVLKGFDVHEDFNPTFEGNIRFRITVENVI